MANKKQQKLELTWIGKGEEPTLEPRILIENPEYSYGDPNTENLLIHGDNLLALKALEQDYTGKVKCIYIDPPFNTGNAFEHYDDNLEHSLWLDLMSRRISILYNLLSDDGAFFLHLDDDEVHYAKIICDEIFLRKNFIATVAIKSSTPSGVKTAHKDKKLIKQKDLMLVYKKTNSLRLNPQYIRRKKWDTHFNYFIDKESNSLVSFTEVLKKEGLLESKQKLADFDIDKKKNLQFYLKNSHLICQTQSFKNEAIKKESRELKDQILYKNKGQDNELMFYNGRQLTPLKNSLNEVRFNDEYIQDFSILLCDFWDDVDFQNTQNEGSVSFPNSKKPEFLVNRVLRLCTEENDLVLDSFLGSGTTAAVAHKMGRKYIGIEVGNHAYTHCFERLKKVVDNEDTSGISKLTNWQGGGGFKFYELAPSLLNKDKYDNWVISKEYNPAMLAAAMAKQEGFTYAPDKNTYWKQGYSAEQDFIFTTTQFVTVELLDQLQDQLHEGESLLICAKKFQPECHNKFKNIVLKKIPKMLLGKCEFGKDDYSLNIINPPVLTEEELGDEE